MDIVKTLLDVAAVFVTPDWGALVQLIPVGLAILVIAWLLLTVRRFATAGPTRRAPARIEPIPPPTLHMPGGSTAPILVAFGTFALFAGVILGGLWLVAGVTVLVLTLITWGREALRDYSHLEPATGVALPAVIQAPPPGVHMPGPSIRPLMGALGSAGLFLGLVLGGWVLVVALVFLAYTLIGWLVDFTAEYRKVEEADATGHLENIVPRRLPTLALGAFGVLFVLVALVQAGIFPPRIGTAGAPGASPSAAAASLPAGTLAVVAKDVAYDTHALSVPANQPFHIQFTNNDGGVPHDIDIRDASGTTIQDQPHVTGVATQTYDYKPLAPGTYTFICSVHPIAAMTGTLTVGP